ncbi:MAG: purine-binding chemotaxis protein CheW [Deltaproteobacteria bacterium]|nr:purine-binding chemotaxis protein CheW [Deltaproteobacteria bacterium]
MNQYVTFRLSDQLFGIEILLVREINQIMESTFVQLAPDYIVGLINLRGQIVTIFDLAVRLDMGRCQIGEETHNIILKSNAELSAIKVRENRDDLKSSDDTLGLRVDSIGDVMEFDESKIELPPANIGRLDNQFLSGVISLENELLILMNAGSLLQKDMEDVA